jgi:hypothetical protein
MTGASVFAHRASRRRWMESHRNLVLEGNGFSVKRINAGGAVPADAADLSQHVAESLERSTTTPSGGAVLLSGLQWPEVPSERYRDHASFFSAVWSRYDALRRPRSGSVYLTEKLVEDGKVPPALYGTKWTFKSLHSDSKSKVFSHLFGQLRGFEGGNVILVDMRSYFASCQLSFEDVFEWADENQPTAKCVVRAEHSSIALDRFGIDLGPLHCGATLLVNNSPESGIFHAASELTIRDEASFSRSYHRCSASSEVV